ncbi:MAG: hypothetical protein KDA24_06365 [Deltaproteobacteria bacterium]|nr:hypothetical protein [Deltaproteobacteria bacterium]
MTSRALLFSLLVTLLLPASALAGGIGVFNGTGFHAGAALSEAGGTGTWINEGGGFELFFGKRDFRLHGRLRFGYNAVIDVTPLAEGAVAKNRVGHSAALSVGAKVELLPDVEKPFGFYIATDVGISPLVLHLRNYFWVNAGPGVRVDINEVFGLFAELTGVLRYENGFTGGAWLYLGARFSFD